MKQIFLICLLFSILVAPVSAHPGRTDSSGCHTCRTNCPSWGLSFGEYHCHNGGGSAPQESAPVYVAPTNTPRPLPTWTSAPTKKPTSKPKPTRKPTLKKQQKKIKPTKAVKKPAKKKVTKSPTPRSKR